MSYHRHQLRSNRSIGFTLVEVLVALAILAVALMAAVRAAGQGTSNVSELRSRLLAGWVAENVLAEQRASGAWLSIGNHQGAARQANMDFSWREEVMPTPNNSFRRVEVVVFSASDESYPLARLTGFLVQQP